MLIIFNRAIDPTSRNYHKETIVPEHKDAGFSTQSWDSTHGIKCLSSIRAVDMEMGPLRPPKQDSCNARHTGKCQTVQAHKGPSTPESTR